MVVPNQDTYLSPFCDDTPASLGKWMQIYNMFVCIGYDFSEGQLSPRITSIANTMPYVTGRVYDPAGTLDLSAATFWGFRGSSSSPSFLLAGGQVIVKNTLIELKMFTTNFNELASHWSPGHVYGDWDFTNNGTSYAFMCVLFDAYNSGVVDSTEPLAKIVYVQEEDLDYSIMAPLWIIRVVRTGSTPAGGTALYLEHADVDTKIEQIGFWKNFIIDGGDLD